MMRTIQLNLDSVSARSPGADAATASLTPACPWAVAAPFSDPAVTCPPDAVGQLPASPLSRHSSGKCGEAGNFLFVQFRKLVQQLQDLVSFSDASSDLMSGQAGRGHYLAPVRSMNAQGRARHSDSCGFVRPPAFADALALRFALGFFLVPGVMLLAVIILVMWK